METTWHMPARKVSEAFGWLLAGAVVATALPSSAWAFCRTTTCDNTSALYDPDCLRDEGGCSITGFPLEWRQRCVSFSVEAEGSPLRGISYDEAVETISNALTIWGEADCVSGRPSIEMIPFEAYECAEVGHSKTGPNSNAWVFRDEEWQVDESHTPEVLALTTITNGSETGEIFDVDVEINSEFYTLTESDNSAFAGVVLHEAGHVFGLADLRLDEGADSTMYYNYRASLGSTTTLGSDDAAGICAIYPPDAAATAECDPTPRRGFSPECPYEEPPEGSCSCTLPRRRPGAEVLAWPVVALFAWLRRKAGLRCSTSILT